jgi:oligoribonuclease
MNQKCSLLWIDLEMTGLDAERDVILEIAAVATDSNLETIIEGPSITIHQPQEFLDGMNDYVKEMHTKSGLLERVAASNISVLEAELAVIKFAIETCDKEVYFSGNSIYQDRTFLKKYMPRLNERGHYRMVDVSTLKVLIQAWYPQQPEIYFKKSKEHRALIDIYESIEELRHYREHFFR